MNDYTHALQQQHALQHALEERFGRAADWPIGTQAAHATLETMQRLMGNDYVYFVECAQQAITRHRERHNRTTLCYRRDHLSQILRPGAIRDLPDTLDVGWALNNALEGLLSEERYEQLIDAAVEAARPAVTA
ncbi:hypothetical protein GCM10010275_30340 [Streptomyces litmocidini]|uniref:hypothetical protein n=1 Tax=Streptomyces litmocidini TaxID=67318 RepID=UPI00167E95FA|nr:hypothetical protein [Streptomyces litmocidini]GGU91162.1 hypothetical protein GCM10010275_30340 [Streptomyces litmocidini]